jgi:ketosteroid isomerase-like protein
MKCIAAVGLALSLVLSSCESSPKTKLQEGESTPADMMRVLSDYEDAWHRKDPAQLASLFVDDGFVLPNGHPPVRGRSAIREYYTGKGGPLALRAIAWSSSGSVGYIIGGYARERGADDEGKFTLTLSRDSYGRWRIVSDMDNGNR